MNSVLIVDDHPVARLAVRMLLEKDGMTVIGETDDGLKAVQQVRQLLPDLVIVDIDIPSINGINVVQRLRANDFKGGILFLTERMTIIILSAVPEQVPMASSASAIICRNFMTLSALSKVATVFSPLIAPARTPLAIFLWTTKIKSPACLKRNCRFCTF